MRATALDASASIQLGVDQVVALLFGKERYILDPLYPEADALVGHLPAIERVVKVHTEPLLESIP